MSAFPPEMSPAQLPADWRERLLGALAGEGVTEPPYMPIWRLVLIDSLKLSAEFLVAFLSFFAAVVLVFWIFGGDPPWAVSLLVFVGLPIIGVWFGAPPVNRVVHQLKMDFYGRNATHAVMKTRRPPIFYLRSFAFDQAASATPTFYQHLPDLAGGIFAQPTPEMALIFRVRHYAPVLAIGRPGESAPPARGDSFSCHRCALGDDGQVNRAVLRDGDLGERQYARVELGDRTSGRALAAPTPAAVATYAPL